MPHVDHQPLWIDGSVRRLPNLEESLRQLQAEIAIQLIDLSRHKHLQCVYAFYGVSGSWRLPSIV
jgi:hypothetical protein